MTIINVGLLFKNFSLMQQSLNVNSKVPILLIFFPRTRWPFLSPFFSNPTLFSTSCSTSLFQSLMSTVAPPVSASSAAAGSGLGYGIAIAIGILVLISTIMLTSYACTRIKGNGNGSVSNNNGHGRHFTAGNPIEPMTVVVVGLAEPIIDSCTKMVLGESRRLPKPNEGPCSICLSDYQPKDTIRCIPDCHHCFHVDCIDGWLKMSATCPLCRNSPAPSKGPTPVTTPLAEVVPLAFHVR